MQNDIELLEKRYSNCIKCSELVNGREKVVFGSGNCYAKILLIGEAPGATEAKKGIPFCGMSGEVLNKLLDSVGLTRNDVFITNTILCRPQKNRNPTKLELANCKPRLNQLIKIMRPKVIVTIGNFATKQILGKTGITKFRGKVFDLNIEELALKVVPVVHPAVFLYSGRNIKKLEEMRKDFQVISNLVQGKI